MRSFTWAWFNDPICEVSFKYWDSHDFFWATLYMQIWFQRTTPNKKKMKILAFPLQNLETQPENPFPKVPQSSCIFWDGRGHFWDILILFDLPSDQAKNQQKWCRNCSLLPFCWSKHPLGPCPNQRAPHLEVHSQIESLVRPNGTPVMPLLHFGQVRLPSDRPLCRWNYAYLVHLEKNFKIVVSRTLHDQIRS